ncbi:hypothetical protein ACS0TY_000954 [Phlomoides rotata]
MWMLPFEQTTEHSAGMVVRDDSDEFLIDQSILSPEIIIIVEVEVIWVYEAMLWARNMDFSCNRDKDGCQDSLRCTHKKKM